jgi:hypothetical protein
MDPAVPLAMNDEPNERIGTSVDWIRRRILSPVRGNDFGGFNGRLSPEEPRVTCAQIDKRMRPFSDALIDLGLDIVRYAHGAVFTDGDLYYPQVSLRGLAQVLKCLDFAERVSPALEELAKMPDLDWQNRFRAACVGRLLAGGVCDLAVLSEALAPDVQAVLDDVDRQCIDGLVGQFVLSG